MPPGGGDLQRAFGAFLALNLAQVAARQCEGHLARLGGGDRYLPGVVAHHVAQIGGGDDLCLAHPCGLRPRPRGAEQAAVLGGGGHGGGQGADHGHQRPVERKLPQGHYILGNVIRQDIQRREQRQRDGQVEMAAFLGQVGGGEIDGDAFGRQRDGQGAERRAHPVAGFRDGLVRQSDDRKAWQPGGDRALHLDDAGVDPLKCDRIGPRHHYPCSVLLWLIGRQNGFRNG